MIAATVHLCSWTIKAGSQHKVDLESESETEEDEKESLMRYNTRPVSAILENLDSICLVADSCFDWIVLSRMTHEGDDADE